MNPEVARIADLRAALHALERFIDFENGGAQHPQYVTANGIRQDMPARLRADALTVRAALAAEPPAAGRARNDEWWHEAHGLHGEAHHQAHRPLDLCVPLWSDAAVRELRDAAAYVVLLGNQPGYDDDEWEDAMTLLEAALTGQHRSLAVIRSAAPVEP